MSKRARRQAKLSKHFEDDTPPAPSALGLPARRNGMGHGAPDQGETVEELRARQARLVQAMQARGCHAIEDVLALLGFDGRFVLLACAGDSSVALRHGITDERADEILREAYTARSRLVLPPAGSA